MALGGGDLVAGKAGEGQGVEGRIEQSLGRGPEHVADEAGAEDGRGEGLTQTGDEGQVALGGRNLVIGQPEGVQVRMADAWRVLEAAGPESMQPGGVKIGLEGRQAAQRGV